MGDIGNEGSMDFDLIIKNATIVSKLGSIL